MSFESFSNEIEKMTNTNINKMDTQLEKSVIGGKDISTEKESESLKTDNRFDLSSKVESFDSVSFDKKLEMTYENLSKEGIEVKEDDIQRAERLHKAFGQIDGLFSSDRIVEPTDVKNVQIDSITDIIADMSFEEATAAVTYFIANKMGISEYTSDTNLVGFKASPQRQRYLKEVKEFTNGNNSFADGWRAFSEGVEETAETVGEWVDSVGEAVSDTIEKIGDLAEETRDNIETGLDELAGRIVDTAKLVCYFSARSIVGVFRTLEDTHDYLAGSIIGLVDKERAYEIVQSCVSDTFSEKLNEVFDVSENEKRIGDIIDNTSESSVDVALSILFFAGGPIGAAIALTAMFLENSGEKLREVTTESGKMGGREYISATISGLAQVAVMALMKSASGAILGKGVKPVAEGVKGVFSTIKGMTGKEIAAYLGGRMTGTLSMALLGGVNAAFMRLGSVVETLTDVALGFEEEFDVVKELKDTLVSIAGGALIGGLFYYASDMIKASQTYQKILHTSYTPDYFHNMYDQVVLRDKYIEAMKAYAEREGLEIDFESKNWDSMKLLSKEDKNAARDAFDNTKERLRAEWKELTGNDWPTYTVKVYDPKTGEFLREKTVFYDMHHIVPVCFGGPNTIENVMPVDPISHRIIHRADSNFSGMTKLFTEALGLSTTGFSAALAGLTRYFMGEN